MGKVIVGLVALMMLGLVGGMIWLAMADITPDQKNVQHVLPDSRFPR